MKKKFFRFCSLLCFICICLSSCYHREPAPDYEIDVIYNAEGYSSTMSYVFEWERYVKPWYEIKMFGMPINGGMETLQTIVYPNDAVDTNKVTAHNERMKQQQELLVQSLPDSIKMELGDWGFPIYEVRYGTEVYILSYRKVNETEAIHDREYTLFHKSKDGNWTYAQAICDETSDDYAICWKQFGDYICIRDQLWFTLEPEVTDAPINLPTPLNDQSVKECIMNSDITAVSNLTVDKIDQIHVYYSDVINDTYCAIFRAGDLTSYILEVNAEGSIQRLCHIKGFGYTAKHIYVMQKNEAGELCEIVRQ